MMKLSIMIPALLLAAAAQGALAADAKPAPKAKTAVAPKTNFLDMSVDAVMDKATAIGVMRAGIPAKVWKLYPASKWVFVSQVEGGVTGGGACVITARAMLLPLTAGTKRPVLEPEKRATTFDMQAGANRDQCRELGKAKLKEALEAVVSSLIKT